MLDGCARSHTGDHIATQTSSDLNPDPRRDHRADLGLRITHAADRREYKGVRIRQVVESELGLRLEAGRALESMLECLVQKSSERKVLLHGDHFRSLKSGVETAGVLPTRYL